MADSPASSIPPVDDAAQAVRPSVRRKFDRRLLGLLGVVIVIAALLAVELPQFLASTPNQTVWQAITAGIKDGTVPKQTALEAFAYVYRVNIPGVTVPRGANGGDAPTSGTGVMRWVKANWSALTPDQQAVINRYTAPQPGPHFTPGTALNGGSASGIELTSWRGGSGGAAQQAPAKPLVTPIDLTMAPDAPLDLSVAMANDIAADVAHLGPNLGMPVISKGSLAFPNISLTMSDTDGGNGIFLTQAIEDGFGNYFPCRITAWKNEWTTEQVVNGGVSPVLHDLLTHEVIHCYQNVVWGDVATALAIPPWITEGTAIYLSAQDTGTAEPMIPSMWIKGYFDPEIPLTNRSYDAFGYYSLLAQQGRDLWSLMLPAWQAAAKGAQRSDAFIAVLKGDDPDIRNNWAESYLRQDSWGDPWIAYGFGLPDAAQVIQHQVQALSDPGWEGTLQSRSNTVLNVTSSVGEVVAVVTDGLASVHDGGTNSSTAFQEQRFCTADSCVCPPGTLLAGQDMAPQKLSIPFVAAFNAPEGGSRYDIVSFKLDDLCKRPATPTPAQPPSNSGPCGPACTNSNGDPHMLTLNRYRYDFQAAGEFTLLRSKDGTVDIQARQEPWQSSQSVAINTAIAAKVGSHKVGVYFTPSGLQAHVDGTVVDLSSGPMDLGGGGRIALISNGFQIDFPDGTQLWTLSRGQWGIFAQVKPSAAIATTGQGLLGEVIPGGLGVPSLPDGTRLPAASDKHQRFLTVYGQFADAWRVTDSTTLFDYDPGKSTATYTIKPFPIESKAVTITDLSAGQQTAGGTACAAITDPGLHDNCVFDVGVTGQAGFADGYAAVATFYDTGIVAATPTPTLAPSASPAPGKVSGAWQVAQGVGVSGFTIGANDTVYATIQATDGTFKLMALDPASQKILAQVPVAAATEVHYAAGSVWLPGLEADSNGNTCSVTRFDGQTLAKQATVAVPCGYFGKPEMASDGDAMWFVDVSKYDGGTGKGAVMTRLDPQTNTPGTSVPLPFINGYRIDSQGALFYYDTGDKGYYRLTTGGSAFDQLGVLRSPVHAAGTGLWVGSQDGKTAAYYTTAGTPAATLQTGGSVVAGDATAAYVEVLGNNPQGQTEEQLWRHPVDGSTPTQIASSPTIDGSFLSYFGDPMPISNGDGVLKFWSTHSGFNQQSQILLQWTPTK